MAKSKAAAKKVLQSYSIKGTNKVVKAGDCVLMRAQDPEKPPYVARIESIEIDGKKKNVIVNVRWYYRPEESIGGRRQFHGVKELFLSDHYDIQSADTIEGKCTVHSFKNYTKLESVGSEDYFCRFEYKAATGGFTPDRVAVYCKCEMPYNPDDLMVQCETCKDWFHPACLNMTTNQLKTIEHFICPDCLDDSKRKPRNGAKDSSSLETKVNSQVLKGNLNLVEGTSPRARVSGVSHLQEKPPSLFVQFFQKRKAESSPKSLDLASQGPRSSTHNQRKRVIGPTRCFKCFLELRFVVAG